MGCFLSSFILPKSLFQLSTISFLSIQGNYQLKASKSTVFIYGKIFNYECNFFNGTSHIFYFFCVLLVNYLSRKLFLTSKLLNLITFFIVIPYYNFNICRVHSGVSTFSPTICECYCILKLCVLCSVQNENNFIVVFFIRRIYSDVKNSSNTEKYRVKVT